MYWNASTVALSTSVVSTSDHESSVSEATEDC